VEKKLVLAGTRTFPYDHLIVPRRKHSYRPSEWEQYARPKTLDDATEIRRLLLLPLSALKPPAPHWNASGNSLRHRGRRAHRLRMPAPFGDRTEPCFRFRNITQGTR